MVWNCCDMEVRAAEDRRELQRVSGALTFRWIDEANSVGLRHGHTPIFIPSVRSQTMSGSIASQFRASCVVLAYLSFGAVNGQSFYQTLGDVGVNEGGQCVELSPTGNQLIGGYRADSAMVMEMDPFGGVAWTYTFKPCTLPCVVMDLTITPDGFIIGCGAGRGGVPPTNQEIFYFKMDLLGGMIWTWSSNDPRPVYALRIEAPSAAEYILFSDIYDVGAPTYADMIRQRIDAATGNVTWTSPRLDLVASNPYLDDISGTCVGAGGRTYATGRIYLNGAPPSGMRPFVSAFSPTGSHVWSKYFVIPAAGTARLYGMDLLFFNDSLTLLFTGDMTGTSTNFVMGLMRMDTLGNVAWTRTYDIVGSVSESGHGLIAHPLGYVMTGTQDNGQKDQFVISTTLNGNVIWGWVYGTPTSDEDIPSPYSKNAVTVGSELFITGRRILGANEDLIAMHTDFNGLLTCPLPPGMTITYNTVADFSDVLTVLESPDAIPFVPYGPAQAFVQLPDGCAALDIDLGPDTVFCDTLILDATFPGAVYYSWQDGSGFPTYTVTDTGFYYVEVFANCCLLRDTIHVGSGIPPVPDFILPLADCGVPVDFVNTSTLATSYLWDFGDGSTSTATDPTHTYAAAGNYTVTLTATNSCTSASIQQSLDVLPTPVTPGFTAADSACVGDPITIIDTSTGATQYQYTFGDGGVSGLPGPSHTYLTAGVFTIIQTVQNACDTATISQTITVIPQPTVAIIGDTIVCPADSILLVADTTGSGLLVQWFPGGATTGSIWVSPSAATTYTVTVTNAVGCSAIDQLNVGIPTAPTLTLLSPDTVCIGDDALLVAQSTLPGPFIWNTSASTDDSLIVSPTTTTTYSVSVLDSCSGMLLQASHTIIALQPPLAIIDLDSVAGCQPLEVVFSDASTSADPILSWTWDFGDGGTSTDEDPTYTYTTGGDFLASLVVTTIYGCSDTADTSAIVIVHPKPVADFVVEGEPLEWPDGIAVFNNLSTGDSSWVWDFGDEEGSTGDAPVHQYSEPGSYPVELIVTNEFGCTDTAEYLLVVEDGYALYVPNTITTNGDGMNDVFTPIGAGIVEYELTIFDRWGELLFQKPGPTSWDGTYNGSVVQEDVYVWRIVARDRHFNRHEVFGHVTVLH